MRYYTQTDPLTERSYNYLVSFHVYIMVALELLLPMELSLQGKRERAILRILRVQTAIK
jgi:hypothetical protein